ncbi:putative leucine-rich repeat domain superfamily [Helianthus debilis subsp. tardiflorus]
MLESCGFHATNGLRVLEQKSLINIVGTFRGGFISMHDRVIEMGENIVRREHPDEPERHSRLWVQEEIERVLADNSGSETTRCSIQKITPGISLEGMGNMKKLRCLTVNHMKYKFLSDYVKIDEVLQYFPNSLHFPNSLRYLYWFQYPHWCLPKTFKANNLVALEMNGSKIKQLWEGRKIMKKLKFLDLSHSKKLRSLDLGLTPNLERLNLEYCKKLVKLCVHGGCLRSLVYLNLSSCLSLKSISFIEQMESLEVLDMGSLNMKEIPDYIITGHSRNTLLELNLSWNMIEEVPSSIGNLHKLVSLYLSHCYNLKSLPGSIRSLQHLTTLDLSFTDIEELPEDLGQLECLEKLNLTYTKVKHLPGSICILKHLNTLILWGCEYLEKLPKDVGQLESLGILDLHNCSKFKRNSQQHLLEKLPEELGNLKCLQLLDVWDTGITHLPQSIYSVKGLTIESFELIDRVLDDDFFQLCFKYDSEKCRIHGFQHLRTIDLGRCVIEEVPEALGQLECLEELYLNCTNVKHLPDTICMLKHLKKLFLISCLYLEKLPDDVGQLESLEEIYLLRCYDIRDILNNICTLKHLRKLVLEGCGSIEELPEAVGQLECLEELHLSYADVKHLPGNICMLKHLKKLVLRLCVLLEKLPDDVGQLESLEVLALLRCYSIRDIPSSICKLKKLKILDLYHCFCLEKLPEDVGQLESLEGLYLSRCYNIREIPNSIFMLKHLKRLNLEGCRRLEKLPDKLGELESLQMLVIWNTGISHLPRSILLLNGLKIYGFTLHTNSAAPFLVNH